MLIKESIQNYMNHSRVLIRGVDFIYIQPHLELRNFISNYTITFPSNGMMSDNYAVIPHGSATLVLTCTDSHIHCNLFGPITKPSFVGKSANNFSLLFIVEFQPAGYYAFSGMPQKEIADCVIDFEDINPSMNRLMAYEVEMSLSIHNLITKIDRLFLAYLEGAFYRQEFSQANNLIINSGGTLSVKELSHNVFYSERHLGRLFDEYMGVGIKSFSRLVRVNKSIRLLQRHNFNLTQVFMETGFYDKSHFINDFKTICGITPQEYRDNMSDFYSEIAKF
ncbi:AraC family transcriptional regulator [Lacrimispora amygdalina]|uniref:AraC family transcriptional regulator n=1 Tax=Lacrimispora amygdalina TaxID=253257 RepID=A0A3E2N7L5_9FIRM|nr:helix-turn-helix transcriptional regulator [Clostridium indicum]RFZ76988.1 AraC family transcriptional regulator [Clostridium indicum]